jgi:hypothetical protein
MDKSRSIVMDQSLLRAIVDDVSGGTVLAGVGMMSQSSSILVD